MEGREYPSQWPGLVCDQTRENKEEGGKGELEGQSCHTPDNWYLELLRPPLACWLSWHLWQVSVLITENNYVGSNRGLIFVTKQSGPRSLPVSQNIIQLYNQSFLFRRDDEIPEIAGSLKSMLTMINWCEARGLSCPLLTIITKRRAGLGGSGSLYWLQVTVSLVDKVSPPTPHPLLSWPQQ